MIGASEGNRIRFYDLMNIEDGFVQLMLTPSTSTRVVVAAHTLKLSEQNDLFYSGGGARTAASASEQTNACGGVRDTGSLSHLLPAGHIVATEQHRREVEQLWGVPPGTISDKPGLDAVNLFRAMEDGRVQAVLLMCTNPAQSLPAADRYRAGTGARAWHSDLSHRHHAVLVY
jgi:hypothetical protein